MTRKLFINRGGLTIFVQSYACFDVTSALHDAYKIRERLNL